MLVTTALGVVGVMVVGVGVGDPVLQRIARSVLGRLGQYAVLCSVESLVISRERDILQGISVAVEQLAPQICLKLRPVMELPRLIVSILHGPHGVHVRPPDVEIPRQVEDT